MTKQERADYVRSRLGQLYPETPVPLDHEDPFTLLVAVLLLPWVLRAWRHASELERLRAERLELHSRIAGLEATLAAERRGGQAQQALIEESRQTLSEAFKA